MSLNTRLVDSLTGLTPEPPAADTYKGDEKLYTVFNYTLIPADFGDDDAGHYRALVQVHLYAPHELNTVSLRKTIAARLAAEGFTRPSITPASDATGQHYVFECEDIEAVE